MSKSQSQLIYSEDNNFYASLDKLVNEKKEVEILCPLEALEQNTGLRKRLQQCSNWKEIESQIPEARKSILATSGAEAMAASVTLTIVAVSIAVLIAGILFYAIYKKYNANLEVEIDPVSPKWKIRIKLNPCEG